MWLREMFICFFVCALKDVYGFINLADVECGMNGTRQGRIVGGKASAEAEFPWAASLWRQGVHQCGATIVTHSWLLTAGHCICSVTSKFFLPRQLKVVAGYHDLSSTGERESLSKILPHPDYRCDHTANDVALLQTTHQLKWTQSLKPACLPQPVAPDYSGALATVAGWGWTHEDRGQGKRPNVLHKVEVKVVQNMECTQWYHSQGKKIQVTTTQMCAGHEEGGRDSCWADSGGPLMIEEEGGSGRSFVAGVVSTGHGCARTRLPGIYTRVSRFVDWIINSIEGEQASVKSGLDWYPK